MLTTGNAKFKMATQKGNLTVVNRLLELEPRLQDELLSLDGKYQHRLGLVLIRYKEPLVKAIDESFEQAKFIAQLSTGKSMQESVM